MWGSSKGTMFLYHFLQTEKITHGEEPRAMKRHDGQGCLIPLWNPSPMAGTLWFEWRPPFVLWIINLFSRKWSSFRFHISPYQRAVEGLVFGTVTKSLSLDEKGKVLRQSQNPSPEPYHQRHKETQMCLPLSIRTDTIQAIPPIHWSPFPPLHFLYH